MAKEAPFHREKTSQNLRGVSEGSREPLKEEEEAGAGVGGGRQSLSHPEASWSILLKELKAVVFLVNGFPPRLLPYAISHPLLESGILKSWNQESLERTF